MNGNQHGPAPSARQAGTSLPALAPRLSIRTTADTIEAVPLLLGFTPVRSVVTLMVDYQEGGSDQSEARQSGPRCAVTLTSRAELPSGAAETDALVDKLDQHVMRRDALVLLTYGELHHGMTVLDRLCRAWRGRRVLAAIAVGDNRWVEIDPHVPSREVNQGGLSDEPGRFTADAVLAGVPVSSRTRDDLADQVRPPSPETATAFATEVRRHLDAPQLPDGQTLLDLMRQVHQGGPRTGASPSNDARLVAAVQDLHRRDLVWSTITRDNAHTALDLWAALSRQIDGPLALPVLALTGVSAWIAGDGASANLVLDRAATTTGADGYRMFELLRSLLELGVDPAMWDSVRSDLVRQLDSYPNDRS